MPKKNKFGHFFRVKTIAGKQYLYKVFTEVQYDKPYPKQKNLYIGKVDKIKEVLANA